MEALRDLVASAVGYDESRGDVITLKSLQFEPLNVLGTAAEPSLWTTLGLDMMSMIQAAVLAIVALVLGLFVIRPILSQSRTEATPAITALNTAGQASDDIRTPQPSLTGEIDTSDMDTESLPVVSGRSAIAASQAAGDDPVARLREMISGRQEETVEILRT
jgi:flagellar M-ring protein FliF